MTIKIKETNSDAFKYAEMLSRKLNKYSQPLKEYMGVSLFGYMKIFSDNTLIYSTNRYQVVKSMIEHSIKEENIIFYKYLLGKERDAYAIIWPQSPYHPAMQCLKELGYWNGMSVLRFENSSVV